MFPFRSYPPIGLTVGALCDEDLSVILVCNGIPLSIKATFMEKHDGQTIFIEKQGKRESGQAIFNESKARGNLERPDSPSFAPKTSKAFV